jgi:hypothetical protein
MTPELEIILAEGAGLQPGYTTQKVIEKRNRCKLGQVALTGTSSSPSSQVLLPALLAGTVLLPALPHGYSL